jgi:hypothetical protein
MRQSSEIPVQKFNGRLSLLIVRSSRMKIFIWPHMFFANVDLRNPSQAHSSAKEAFAANIRCYADCCKILWGDARLADASCGALSQSECVIGMQLLFLQCMVHIRLRTFCTSCETSVADGRLALNCFETFPSVHFVQKVTAKNPIEFHEMFPCFGGGALQKRQWFGTLRFW